VKRACEHVRAGWTVSKTCDLIEREFDARPNVTTVRTWTDERYARDSRRREAARQRATREARRKPGGRYAHSSPEWRLARMRELAEHGLDPSAIAAVALVWWGEAVSPQTVRSRLGGHLRPRFRNAT
jgi:hypothetical protein